MHTVLVLAASLSQAADFRRHLAGGSYSDVRFRYPSCISKGEQTPQQLLVDCKNLLKKEKIDVVLNVFPTLVLVQAALGSSFAHIRCASLESTLLCTHRFYSRQVALRGFNCRFGLLHLADLTEEIIAGVVEEIGLPLTVVENFQFGMMQQRRHVRTLAQLHRELPRLEAESRANIELACGVLEAGNLTGSKYPLVLEPNCLIEQLQLDPDAAAAACTSTHYVEGCVLDGEVTPWVISDVIVSPKFPSCTKAVAVPTQLDEAGKFHMWAVFRGVVENVRHLNFDNQFLTLKASINTRSGRVLAMGVYACTLRGSTPLYRHTFQNGDNIRAQIQMSTGEIFSRPKLLAGRAAMRAYVTTFRRGRASAILDYKAIRELSKENAQLYLQGLPLEDAMIEPDAAVGFRLAEVNIFGTSYSDTVQQMEELMEKVVIDTDRCNWAMIG